MPECLAVVLLSSGPVTTPERVEAPPGGMVAPAWAIVGVSTLFAWAVYRLGGRGIAVIREGLGGAEWLALIALTFALVYVEGIRALDRRWVPALMDRVRDLRRERSLTVRLLAPLYGLSLIGLPRARLVRGWLGTSAIVLAIVLVRLLPEPWRGIVDFAVAAALAWGLAAILRRTPSVWTPG